MLIICQIRVAYQSSGHAKSTVGMDEDTTIALTLFGICIAMFICCGCLRPIQRCWNRCWNHTEETRKERDEKPIELQERNEMNSDEEADTELFRKEEVLDEDLEGEHIYKVYSPEYIQKTRQDENHSHSG